MPFFPYLPKSSNTVWTFQKEYVGRQNSVGQVPNLGLTQLAPGKRRSRQCEVLLLRVRDYTAKGTGVPHVAAFS
jgi:hypothetical protein